MSVPGSRPDLSGGPARESGGRDPILFHDSERIEASARRLRETLNGPVSCATILGSGFAPLADLATEPRRVAFSEVEGLGACTAPGHAGELVAGTLGGARHLFIVGRLHLYEGRRAGEVAVPVALAAALGADRIVLTCAAGATSESFPAGSLLGIEDHLNLTGTSPLLTVPVPERRPAFLAMGDAYDRPALALAERIARESGAGLRFGVLAGLAGPCFETPAEYRMLARLGADVVSMSCVLETIAARYLGLRVLALAVVANGPSRLGEAGVRGEEVIATVEAAVRGEREALGRILAGFAAL